MQKAVNDAVFWGSLKKATLNIEIKNIFYPCANLITNGKHISSEEV